jgi:D-serine deaminase-like pyridoxal phosphate-dependent protein
MNINDLETPAILIDIDRMQRNIQRMQAHCDNLGINFRPHIKTHKIPEIARRQLEAGAIGIACQKLSETQIFVDAGFNNIQIPYNIVGQQKLTHLTAIAKSAHITVSADHSLVIQGLADAAESANITLNVMVEMATNIQRTGAPIDHITDLAKQITTASYLQFAGILVYPSYTANRPALLEVLSHLETAGINVPEISGGGTEAAFQADQFLELTELRVGTYVFYDWMHIKKGIATEDDCAMRIAATVVSTPSDDRIILDSGSKTLSSDRIDNEFGYIVEYPQARMYQLNEEHAYVDVSHCDQRPTIGDRVHIIPVHTCVVTNLANQIYGHREEKVEATWKVAARGLVQ